MFKNSWAVDWYQRIERGWLNKLREKSFKLKKIMLRGKKN
jgi:hypothetical protein